ncbi:MAG: hypothetical protein WCI31_08070 [Prolixibacteraceae bacterium]
MSKIDNIEKLRFEQNKLKIYCTYQEKLLGLQLEHFKVNYSSIIGNELLPYDKSQTIQVNELLDSVNNLIANLLPGIFKGKFLPGFILKILQLVMINTFTKKR